MSEIGIIDYGMGNLGSVRNACRFLGLPHQLITAPEQLAACDALILPGVGAFGDCMSHLREHGFVEPVTQWIADDRPFLGICLGLQVLFEGSEESPETPGLGILPGQVTHFERAAGLKVPQIGWNRVRQRQPECPLFVDIPDESYFYFVHSYYAPATTATYSAGLTTYGVEYTAAVWRGRLLAVQFHPEKSQQHGLCMLNNFASWVEKGNTV
jgi:imidazole glycerol-phosphate synthase subunit HisH